LAVRQLTEEAVGEFERCIGRGGVAVFPADTVYGLACNPGSPSSIARMYALKGREERRPAAVMFFQLERALAALDWLDGRTVTALRRLLPGPVTAVVPNPVGRYALAGTGAGGGLGLRVPALDGTLEPLSKARVAVLQTSANQSGARDARSLEELDAGILKGVDIVLDGGERSGTPSTVVDLTRFERAGEWSLLREAALSRDDVANRLAG
jgi:L-threonylcarbamoyladenylate synthase